MFLGLLPIDLFDKIDEQKEAETHPSLESKMPWRTDLNALAAVALMHIINPYKWKLGSPYQNTEVGVLTYKSANL